MLSRVSLVAALLLCGACQPPKDDPRLDQAGKLLAEGQPEQAAVVYGVVYDDTEDPRALLGKGLSLRMSQQWEPAAESLTRALALSPRHAHAMAALAHSLTMLGRPDDARAQAEAMCEAHPESLTGPLLLAVLADNEQRSAKVLADLKALRERRRARTPDAAEGELLWAMADLTQRNGDTHNAELLRNAARRADLANPGQAVELAKLYLRVGRDVSAERLLAAVFRKHPDLKSAHGPLALVAARRGDWGLARSAFNELSQAKRALPAYALVDGQLLMRTGNMAEAAEVLAKGLAAAGEDPILARQIAVELARALAGSKQDADARSTLLAAQVGPESPVQLREAAALLWASLGDRARAQALWESLLTVPSHADKARGALVELDVAGGDDRRAIQRARAWMEERPGDPDRRYLLAVALNKGGEPKKAAEALDALLQAKPDHLPALALAVQIADGTKRARASRKVVDAAVARASRSSEVRNFAATYFEQRKQYEEAEAQLQAWSHLDEDAVEPRLRMGRLALKRGMPERGMKLLRFAATRRPDDVLVLTEVAQAEAVVGERSRAVELYERLLEVAPGHVAAMNNLAYLYGENDATLGKALTLAERAHRARPRSPSIADTYGWILHRKGESSKAVEVLQKAVEGNGERATLRYHLGMAMLAAGDAKGGAKQLQRALSLDASFSGADEARAALAK